MPYGLSMQLDMWLQGLDFFLLGFSFVLVPRPCQNLPSSFFGMGTYILYHGILGILPYFFYSIEVFHTSKFNSQKRLGTWVLNHVGTLKPLEMFGMGKMYFAL